LIFYLSHIPISVWIYEKENEVSVQSINAAFDYLMKNSSAGINIVKKEMVDLSKNQPTMIGLEQGKTANAIF